MLLVALGVTIVGFILLIVALVTGTVWFAWACIGVCVIGFILLVVDVLSGRRGGPAQGAEQSGGRTPGDDREARPDAEADDEQAWAQQHPAEGEQAADEPWDTGGQAWSEPAEGQGEYHSGYPSEQSDEQWQSSNWESFEQEQGRHHAAGSGDSGEHR